MKTKAPPFVAFIACWQVIVSVNAAPPTTFTYQGRLSDAAQPANGSYDLRAILYTADLGGSQVGPIVNVPAVTVADGVFSTELDFGPGAFDGESRWVELFVRRTGVAVYTRLDPRQAITPAPFAQFALTPTGPAGVQGPAGAVGAAGAKGDKGDTGPVGATGLTGTQGAAGPTGASGPQGAKGDTGLTGAAGAVGPQGIQGVPGAVGPVGPQGSIGLMGTAGATGPTGAAGPQGLAGPQGVQGVPGSAGAAGATGLQGPQGIPGSLDAWGRLGNTGTTAGVNYVGTTDNQALEFKVHGIRALRLEPTAEDATHSGLVNVVGGSPANSVGAGVFGATIAGGGSANYFGAHPNKVTAIFGTVGGGEGNTSGGLGTTVGGGRRNTSSGVDATVAGGESNTGSGGNSTVGGGYGNIAGNLYATVPGGIFNRAAGQYSFAAGYRAEAVHDGSLVWAIRDNPAPSFAASRFHINAYNGLSVDYDIQREDGGGTRWIVIGATTGGQAISTSTGAWLSDGGVWVNASDRNRKDGFGTVNSREILDKVAALPIQTWHYTNEIAEFRHLGPMAQDFRAAFGLGSDDKSIATVDADGVALAAIQGLNQKVESENATLRADLQSRDNRIAALEQSVAELKQLMGALASDKRSQ